MSFLGVMIAAVSGLPQRFRAATLLNVPDESYRSFSYRCHKFETEIHCLAIKINLIQRWVGSRSMVVSCQD
jgi:hypothetical protein